MTSALPPMASIHRVGQGLKGQLLHALLGAVPAGDVGGVHADDGHLDAAPLHNGVARAGEIAAVGVLDVGRQDGHFSLIQDGFQGVNAEVELMVAQCPGVVAHVVHGGGHRVVRGVLGVEIVGHDGALDIVARVDEDGVGILCPDLLDVGIQPGHAVVGALSVVLIGVAPDVAVHIRGTQNGDVLLAAGGKGGRHQGYQQRPGGQQREQAAGTVFLHV